MDSSDRSAFLPADALTVLLKDHTGIFPGKFYHFFLGTFLRDHDMNLLFPTGCEPFLDHFSVFNISLKHDLPRYKRCSRIILLEEAGQNLRTGIASCNSQIKMISADHPAASHKENLDNGILFPEIQTLVHRHSNDVAVLFSVSSDLLTLSDLADTLDQITISGSIFESHFFGSRHHLVCEFIDRILKIAIQKAEHLLDVFPVLLLIHMTGTGSGTLLHMVIQTWPVLTAVARKVPAAGANLVQFAYQLDHILDRAATGIRTKISVFVLLHLPGKQNSGICLLHRDLDKRIALVILEHRIIFRTVLFDKVALQNECFQFRICNNIFESRYVGDHLLDLGTLVAAALKILPYTVAETDRLAHIDDRIPLVVHNIHTRSCGKLL